MNKTFIPERNDVVLMDFEPVKGKEVGKYRPTLILSSFEYNRRTGLVICCPISTSIRGHLTEVKIGGLDAPSVVAASLIQTLSWRERRVKFITKARKGILDQVLLRIIPLIGADKLIEDIVNQSHQD